MKKLIIWAISLMLVMSYGVITFATTVSETEENFIPNTSSVEETSEVESAVESQAGVVSEESDKKSDLGDASKKGYAENLFGTQKFKAAPSDNVATSFISEIVGWVIAVAIAIFPVFVMLQLVVDAMCLGFNFVGLFFSRIPPFQMYSDAAAEIMGRPYVGHSSGVGGSPAPNPAPTTGAGGLKGKKKWGTYFAEQGSTISICAIVIAFVAGGLVSGLIFKVVDLALGFGRGVLGM